MSITKNVLLNLYSSMKKEFRKFRMIFDVENSNFGTFWHIPIKPICKIQQFHLTSVDFYPKTFLILYSSLETPQPVLPYFAWNYILNTYTMWKFGFWWGSGARKLSHDKNNKITIVSIFYEVISNTIPSFKVIIMEEFSISGW